MDLVKTFHTMWEAPEPNAKLYEQKVSKTATTQKSLRPPNYLLWEALHSVGSHAFSTSDSDNVCGPEFLPFSLVKIFLIPAFWWSLLWPLFFHFDPTRTHIIGSTQPALTCYLGPFVSFLELFWQVGPNSSFKQHKFRFLHFRATKCETGSTELKPRC